MGMIRCLNCHTVLESKYRHDLKSCKCSNETFIDGGRDYLRYGGKDLRFIEIIEDNSNEVPYTPLLDAGWSILKGKR